MPLCRQLTINVIQKNGAILLHFITQIWLPASSNFCDILNHAIIHTVNKLLYIIIMKNKGTFAHFFQLTLVRA